MIESHPSQKEGSDGLPADLVIRGPAGSPVSHLHAGEGARATTPLNGDSGGLGARQALVDGFSDPANGALLIYAVAINYPR
jgi:hypothetical protein